MKIPIIDIFAGPGGLGEGFSTFINPQTNQRPFKIVLSIEKDKYAHQTLLLRSFFRQHHPKQVPDDYYVFIKGKISLEELFKKWPEQAKAAKEEAWQVELGEGKKTVHETVVDKRIKTALNGEKNWTLIGGPPCQAYSIVGRSRRQEKFLDEKKDKRVGLYKQYLRILALHKPMVFIMENVKGLLSAKTEENQLFSRILHDLANPESAYISEFKSSGNKRVCPSYKIYSLVARAADFDECGNPVFQNKDFVIHSERYGIPQTRHRVILLGIRSDIEHFPKILESYDKVPISAVLSGLPKLRSTLSKTHDSGILWISTIKKILNNDVLRGLDIKVKGEILKQINKISLSKNQYGGEYFSYKRNTIAYRPNWYLDEKLAGVCNHSSRGHMDSDLLRYLFVSCFAKVKNRSPKLEDFPKALLPDHNNVKAGVENKKFADRFRVQLWDRPCKTITSHISKDGHYYIHPDPTQCRSFTVREAARIQTFPDNYYFCGPRTSQFIQVGNAVPPLLANQIAEIVSNIFENSSKKSKTNKPLKTSIEE